MATTSLIMQIIAKTHLRLGLLSHLFCFAMFTVLFKIIKTPVTGWISRPHFTGVTAAQLQCHLSNINVIQESDRYFCNTRCCTNCNSLFPRGILVVPSQETIRQINADVSLQRKQRKLNIIDDCSSSNVPTWIVYGTIWSIIHCIPHRIRSLMYLIELTEFDFTKTYLSMYKWDCKLIQLLQYWRLYGTGLCWIKQL